MQGHLEKERHYRVTLNSQFILVLIGYFAYVGFPQHSNDIVGYAYYWVG
jgi:hypothetical protein